MDSENQLKILIVEDEPGISKIIGMLLKETISAQIDSAEDCKSARCKLSESSYDLVTLDYQLPDGNGLEILTEIMSENDPPAVVMVTGHGDENTAVNAFKSGASGYVVKDTRMNIMLVEEVKSALAKRELEKAERELEESREKYRQMFESLRSGVAVYKAIDDGKDFVFMDFNKGAEAIDSVDRREVIGKSILDVFPAVKEFGLFDVLQRVWRTGEPERLAPAIYEDKRISGWREQYVYKLPSGEIVAIYEDIKDRKIAETLVARVLERLPDAVCLVDDSKNMLFANKAFIRLIQSDIPDNSNLDSLLSKDFKICISGTDKPYPMERLPIDKALKGESTTVDDMELEAGGKRKLVEATAMPILVGGSDVQYAMIVVRDITEQKKVENELIDREAKLRELYDSSVEGIAIVGPDGKYEYLNPMFVEMFGHDDIDEFIQWYSANSYADPEDRVKLLEVLMEKGSVQGYEIHAKRKDGSTFWVLANVTLYKDEDGNPLRTAAFITDITARKLAEDELKRINAELDAYASTISHDLKGPLAAIKTGVDLFAKESEDAGEKDIKKIAEMLIRNTGIAQSRVETLLELAESGQKPSNVEEIDISEVIHGIMQITAHEIEKKGVVIRFDGDQGRVSADRTQIEQLFNNLISNAIKHNDNDRPEILINYLGREPDGMHRYILRDNGSGIEPGKLDDLFDPFSKGKDTGEIGLGLWIARKIVGVYGGDIKAYNENGACFEFRLRDYEE